TVEVSRSVKRFAVSVFADEREVVAEALLEFDDSPLVKRGRFLRVLVCLQNRRIHKAVKNQRPRASWSAPFPVGAGAAVRQGDVYRRCWKRIYVNSQGKS